MARALAVQRVSPGCHISGAVERSQSDVLALAELVAHILAELSTDGKARLGRDLSVNSHPGDTALEAVVAVDIKALVLGISVISAHDAIVRSCAVAREAVSSVIAGAALLH